MFAHKWLILATSATLSAATPKHSTCKQPMNISFWAGAAFATKGDPQVLLSMGTGPTGHVTNVAGLSFTTDGTSCGWVPMAGVLSEARTSGCVTTFDDLMIFAGGHNNSAAYTATIDIFRRADGGKVDRVQTLELPVGRELLGCASAGNVTIFAGGKPPHPPSPIGETTEIDIWNHATQKWSQKQLSVERKKVEAVAIGHEILMAGGEIGHHPPSSPAAPAPAAGPEGVGGYSSSVDILNVNTGTMRTTELSLARQYFAVAVAGGKAFFAGGFANDPAATTTTNGTNSERMPLAGFRSSVVDVYDQATNTWSITHLSTNRSNLMGTAVADRWVVFAGGTRQLATPDLCGTGMRSAVVDIYDTKTSEWSTTCLGTGRTALSATSWGNTAVLFTFDPSVPIDLFTFSD